MGESADVRTVRNVLGDITCGAMSVSRERGREQRSRDGSCQVRKVGRSSVERLLREWYQADEPKFVKLVQVWGEIIGWWRISDRQASGYGASGDKVIDGSRVLMLRGRFTIGTRCREGEGGLSMVVVGCKWVRVKRHKLVEVVDGVYGRGNVSEG